jgi:hypothetical protein
MYPLVVLFIWLNSSHGERLAKKKKTFTLTIFFISAAFTRIHYAWVKVDIGGMLPEVLPRAKPVINA